MDPGKYQQGYSNEQQPHQGQYAGYAPPAQANAGLYGQPPPQQQQQQQQQLQGQSYAALQPAAAYSYAPQPTYATAQQGMQSYTDARVPGMDSNVYPPGAGSQQMATPPYPASQQPPAQGGPYGGAHPPPLQAPPSQYGVQYPGQQQGSGGVSGYAGAPPPQQQSAMAADVYPTQQQQQPGMYAPDQQRMATTQQGGYAVSGPAPGVAGLPNQTGYGGGAPSHQLQGSGGPTYGPLQSLQGSYGQPSLQVQQQPPVQYSGAPPQQAQQAQQQQQQGAALGSYGSMSQQHSGGYGLPDFHSAMPGGSGVAPGGEQYHPQPAQQQYHPAQYAQQAPAPQSYAPVAAAAAVPAQYTQQYTQQQQPHQQPLQYAAALPSQQQLHQQQQHSAVQPGGSAYGGPAVSAAVPSGHRGLDASRAGRSAERPQNPKTKKAAALVSKKAPPHAAGSAPARRDGSAADRGRMDRGKFEKAGPTGNASKGQTRARRRSPSPRPPPAPAPPPYEIYLPPRQLASCLAVDYLALERRHERLHIAPDFVQLVQCWCAGEAPPLESLGAGPLCRLTDLRQPLVTMHKVGPEVQQGGGGGGAGGLAEYDPVGAARGEPGGGPALGSCVYNAKVVLINGLRAEEMEQALQGPASEGGDHVSRLLKFVVARAERERKKVRTGIFALGGRYDPGMDGGESPPCSTGGHGSAAAEPDEAALIRAAIRHVKCQVGLDLTPCSQWVRFLEVHYQRLDSATGLEHHKETTVVFLVADAAAKLMPSAADWPALWKAQRTAEKQPPAPEAEPIASTSALPAAAAADTAAASVGAEAAQEEEEQEDGELPAEEALAIAAAAAAAAEPDEPIPEPHVLLSGVHNRHLRLKTMSISLDGLLDYNDSDREEGTFELSLFAEAFHEMACRDAGDAILWALYKHRTEKLAGLHASKRKAKDTSQADEGAKRPRPAASAEPPQTGKDSGDAPATSVPVVKAEPKEEAEQGVGGEMQAVVEAPQEAGLEPLAADTVEPPAAPEVDSYLEVGALLEKVEAEAAAEQDVPQGSAAGDAPAQQQQEEEAEERAAADDAAEDIIMLDDDLGSGGVEGAAGEGGVVEADAAEAPAARASPQAAALPEAAAGGAETAAGKAAAADDGFAAGRETEKSAVAAAEAQEAAAVVEAVVEPRAVETAGPAAEREVTPQAPAAKTPSSTTATVTDDALLLSFSLFDPSGVGYIKAVDLRTLVESLGRGVHHGVIKQLCASVAAPGRKERVRYRTVCKKQVQRAVAVTAATGEGCLEEK